MVPIYESSYYTESDPELLLCLFMTSHTIHFCYQLVTVLGTS